MQCTDGAAPGVRDSMADSVAGGKLSWKFAVPFERRGGRYLRKHSMGGGESQRNNHGHLNGAATPSRALGLVSGFGQDADVLGAHSLPACVRAPRVLVSTRRRNNLPDLFISRRKRQVGASSPAREAPVRLSLRAGSALPG